MFIRLSKLVPELGVSRRVAYHWAQARLLPGAFQMNGTWLVDLDVFNAWKGEATKWSVPTERQNNLVSSRKPPLEANCYGSLLESRGGRDIARRLEKKRLQKLAADEAEKNGTPIEPRRRNRP
jgi:hypothetical protein